MAFLVKESMVVEQFLPAFHYGDAVSNSAFFFHRFLCRMGVESRLITLTCDANVTEKAIMFADYHEDERALKILHFAIPSPFTDFFLRVGGKKAMVYHNITPSRFFLDFSDFLVGFTTAGREHLYRLKSCFDLALGVSQFNAAELRQLGFSRVEVFPLLIDLAEYDVHPDEYLLQLLQNGRPNILFVGRITPNKCIEDLLKTLYVLKKHFSVPARLLVVGSISTLPKYFQALKVLAARLGLTARDVLFTGHLPNNEFVAAYRAANLFLSLSEHEGFCQPIIESCYFGLPVVAFAAGAIPEILRGAGILVKQKDPWRIAALLANLLQTQNLRDKLKLLGSERVAAYRTEADPAKLWELLQRL